jgi:hypothetical protein
MVNLAAALWALPKLKTNKKSNKVLPRSTLLHKGKFEGILQYLKNEEVDVEGFWDV